MSSIRQNRAHQKENRNPETFALFELKANDDLFDCTNEVN